MSSRSPTAAEIAIPPERIVRELLRNALPGYYGECEIRIALLPEALRGVELVVTPKRKVRSQDASLTLSLFSEDTERERLVRDIVAKLAPKLRLRLETTGIVAHFADGQLRDCDLLIDERVVQM